jgi:hypothetical protein
MKKLHTLVTLVVTLVVALVALVALVRFPCCPGPTARLPANPLACSLSKLFNDQIFDFELRQHPKAPESIQKFEASTLDQHEWALMTML